MTINLIQFFAKTESETPETIAIRDGETSASFAALKAQETKYADWIATAYRTTRCPVAVFLPKYAHTIAADLVIIHSGNAYMKKAVNTACSLLAS